VSQLIDQLADLATVPIGDARLAVVLRNLDFVPAVDAEQLLTAVQAQGLATFRTLDDGAVAVAALARFADTRAARTRAAQES
jgi:hypothetical protein